MAPGWGAAGFMTESWILCRTKIGVAYDEQIVEAVPAEEHDQRVTDIVTPTRWIRVN